MTIFSAKHIAIKKDQDRANFDSNKIVLCDGVGEFSDSARAAEITLDNLLEAENYQEIVQKVNQSTFEIVTNNIIGGTTFIYAKIESDDSVSLSYLGNGSVFHLHGDFHELPPNVKKPYRYSNILLPHANKDGVLLRHISHQSNPPELIPSFVTLSLSGIHGDIILAFTDGISSLEEEIIVTDNQNRDWRIQSECVLTILENLHNWLRKAGADVKQTDLNSFLEEILLELKSKKMLEDDASIGLIITKEVFEYYKRNYVA